jgi:hypothetical protein
MLRSSLLLTPTLALALVAMPATASPGDHGATASQAKGGSAVTGKGRPAGTGGGRRIR